MINELWLSPVSIWEFLILAQKGKVIPRTEPKAWLAEAMQRAPMKEASLNYEIAIESRFIDLPHQDPADRFLAATVRVLDLTLITADKRLLRSRDFSALGND